MKDERLKKRSEESDNEYKGRLYRDKISLGLSSKEINEIINKELGTNLAESTTRCSASIWNDGFDCGFEKALNQREADDEIEKIKLEKLELEKLKIQYQDQKREYKNYLRADARFEHLKNVMKEEIIKLSELRPLVLRNVPQYLGDNEVVSICSDWHTGIKEKNYWNEISIDILKERIESLQNKIVQICNRHEASTLHLEILGDMINGLIHVTTRISNEEDVIKQTMICAEILADMITNLANEIPNIKIYSTIGNHGRCVANATESLDVENFEKLVPWYLEARLVNVENVEFCGNVYDDGIIVYQFLNETIFAVHGHQDKITTAVSDLSKMLKLFPTELHMGHYHSYYEKDDHDISTIVNGTASGVDKYAKGIRKTGKATQTVLVYNSEGRECTYKIKLN
jgi:uncharacterized protein YejL (UPF0352 family)